MSPEQQRQTKILLRLARNKLHQMGKAFTHPNFTDRGGDGPVMLELAKQIDDFLEEIS